MGAYEPNPSYPAIDAQVRRGWDAIAATVPDGKAIVAIDGPAILDWRVALDQLTASLAQRAIPHRLTRTESGFAPWERIVQRTSTPELADDPDFARVATATLREFFDDLPDVGRRQGEVVIVAGPGSALADHDVLWYVDLPKRFAEGVVRRGEGRNLGQSEDGAATTRRLLYIDWPVLDRHRESIAPAIDLWIDFQDPAQPASLDGSALRRTIASLASRPFRTRPTFNTAPWGGHWGQRVLGHSREAPNTAIGYELIAPESGVLIGDPNGPNVEIPFQLIVGIRRGDILGQAAQVAFGGSFPIRFDYLDTVDGGNLSIHCHPQLDYMRRIFGWEYTQHESYYVMVGGDGAKIFLGLQEDVDLAAFERAARTAIDEGEPFDIGAFVQAFPADPHRLFMIPAGTPHGSGDGNVVLEVSATPYLYSLRFYDWLRRDSDGALRAVPIDHAFANLDRERQGEAAVRDLIQEPRVIRSGDGWREESIGSLPEVFYEVRRLVLETERSVDSTTDGRFHVLNVVDGEGVTIDTAVGSHPLNYAETIVIPAAVGRYRLTRAGKEPVRIVKALVR